MKTWRDFLKNELEKDYIKELQSFLTEERAKYAVYPPSDKVFAAMHNTPLEKVKVVILGQDPYHGAGQAMGLCFSVPSHCPLPPSLRNIFKEIETDLGISMEGKKGDLTPWANQGVLLLNTLLTVREALPMSHQGRGWEIFTDRLIDFLLKEGPSMAFMLWGKPAQDKLFHKTRALDSNRHLVLKTTHPSPLSAHRGFLGSGHFLKVNAWLKEKELGAIDWSLNQ
jgi:uracil-DNA glycosylase